MLPAREKSIMEIPVKSFYGAPAVCIFESDSTRGDDMGIENQNGVASLGRRLAYVILRVSLGINMFMHFAGRFHTGLQNWVAATEKPFVDSVLPMWIAHSWLTILSPIEGVVGILLIFGLWTLWTLVAEGVVMTVLVFGISLRAHFYVSSPATAGLTATVSQQMIYLLTIFALLAMVQENHFSLDTLIDKRRK
jgi:thiosulfate dehydrogenase [quinone] large subunit